MTALELEKQLKKLNPRLYISKALNTQYNPELLSSGIYVQGFNDTGRVNLSDADLSTDEYQAAKHVNETPDKYLTWCTWKHVPEGNRYDDKMRITAKGWREILLILSSHNLIDIQKARKAFNRPSLGLEDYDRLTHQQKWERG